MARHFGAINVEAARLQGGGAGEGIVWAVVGTGIDASHPHFRRHDNLRLPEPLRHIDFTDRALSDDLSEQEALTDLHGVGTHCAALIAGESAEGSDIAAVAPRCKLLSLKTVSDDGTGNESDILRALAHILDANRERLSIHGLLLPVGLHPDVVSSPVGTSPVCRMVEDVVRSGVIVVVSAGNNGYDSDRRLCLPYSINDPGNAELAITVGSTHSSLPESHGVSYFSARGPTIDGRMKPDLVAPGEKVNSAWPTVRSPAKPEAGSDKGEQGQERTRDGTSAAASIVAGGCAMILSTRPELIGQPLKVKRLLTESVLDLKRDRYAQGAGLLDLAAALRAALHVESAGQEARPAPAPPAEPEPNEPQPPGGGAVDALQSLAIPSSRKKRFAVAVSFGADQRIYVTEVVRRLRRRGLQRADIFFDEFWRAELAAVDLDIRLQQIYAEESELVVPFFSKGYVSREWPGVEWRTLRDLIKRKKAKSIMPVVLDDSDADGFLTVDGFYDAREGVDPDEVGDRILERLDSDRRKA